MLVYRIEHTETKMGPYTNDRHFCLSPDRHNEHSLMPSPFFDFERDNNPLLLWEDDCRFAIPAWDKIAAFWSEETRTELFTNGYIIGVYDVAKGYVKIGKSRLQCGYHVDHAKLICTEFLI